MAWRRPDRVFYGIEADFQGTGQNGGISAGCVEPICAKASYDLDWFGTLRGRVGYLVDPRALLYLTGGLACGHLSADFSASGIPAIGTASISDSATKAGWVIGRGLEWALNRNWMLRAEYLYVDLGTMRSKLGPVSGSTVGECPEKARARHSAHRLNESDFSARYKLGRRGLYAAEIADCSR
jgi:outer membrane immunogenic protein